MPQELTVRNLQVGFNTLAGYRQALDLGEIVVQRGESFGLVGESGAGKSVFALSLLRLLPEPPAVVRADEITFAGESLLDKSASQMREVRGRQISIIFQDPMSSLNPVFDVGTHLTTIIRDVTKANRREARQRAREAIELVQLPDPDNMLDKYPHQLSGGQRQRVIIALALACGARLLIADEPTRNLDVTVQAGVLQMIAEIRERLGVTVLFIANNLGLVSAMCDRVGILLEGRVVEEGTVDEVVSAALHPYTRSLLKAIPTREKDQLEEEKSRGGVILNEVPTAPAGCSFFGRCGLAAEECASEPRPDLMLVEGTHYVACRRAVSETAQ